LPKISKDKEGKVIHFIRQLFDMADMSVSRKSQKWRDIEQRYRAFVDPMEVNDQSGKQTYPWDETVIIPYSYALLQAIVAYQYTLFTAQSPLKQIQDAHGDNPKGADMMELLIAHYDRMDRANLILYGALLDSHKYGIAAAKVLWEERWETRYQKVQTPVTLAGMNVGMTEETVKRHQKVFDGPSTTLCDPWLLSLDPRVAASNFQDGNFVGETIFTSWHGVKEMEEPYGPYANVDDIPRWGYKDALSIARQSERLRVLGLTNYFDAFSIEFERGFVMLEQLWAKIIPSDLELGPGKRPEMWLFTLANRDTLIQAEPVDLPRPANQPFPFWVIESSPDMHSALNPGTFEILLPLQDFMDWLFNSHIENTRKALNDMFVVDPERVYVGDLLSPNPMKVIRLRPEFYGTDVRMAISQLQVTDVTKNHLQDVAMIFDLMQRVSAALDALMGVPSARRKTASEATGTFQLAANRLKVYAQLISAMGLTAWGEQQAALIQGLMQEPEFVQIIGQRKAAEFKQMAEGSVIKVSPDDIQGEWNFPIHDGSMPLDPLRTSETWEKALMAAAKIPEIAMQYDLGKIFERGLRALGVRDTEELKKPQPMNPKVMPDGQVQQNVQAGNLVPLTNGGPAARGGPGIQGQGPSLPQAPGR
jgi:hypothetical protein